VPQIISSGVLPAGQRPRLLKFQISNLKFKFGGFPDLSKKRASAYVIQAAMQYWISKSGDRDCHSCEAPLPIALLAPIQGCNWVVGPAYVPPGCRRFIIEIVERAKLEYDLIP
jgi:hypothetical protein